LDVFRGPAKWASFLQNSRLKPTTIGKRAMKLLRRQFLQIAGAAAAVPALPRLATALDYPTQPVKVIVPFAAGGGTDIFARLIGQWLQEKLGRPFVVENRAGNATNIGTEVVVRARPDGYTILVTDNAPSINATLYESLPFNFIRDIAPVACLSREPLAIEVNPSVPVKTIPEFIAYAKANPSKVNMASPGTGTPNHMAGELFATMAGIKMTHVPYRGTGPALTDLLGGQVQVMFSSIPATVEYVKTGKVRALAVTTMARSEALPDVPSAGDFVPGYEASTWHGVGAPKATPAEIIEKLNHEINTALADPKIKARFTDLGAMPFIGSAADFAKLIAEDTEKWGKVVKLTGAKPE
jgi:tripartite-type tricarboxylate transporter receptor subunit TctC